MANADTDKKHPGSNPVSNARLPGAIAAGLVAIAGFFSLAIDPALAAYPEQPVKLIIGFPPGGGGNLYGRLIAAEMSKTLGQQMIVENRPGAGGNIAADLVAKAKPDGYTLLLAMSGNLAVAPATRPQAIPYKSPDDFAPIGLILEAPHGLFVGKDSRFMTAKALLAEAAGGKLSFASTGTGAAAHIGMEMVKQDAGIDMLHVPYKGSGPAIIDLQGGQIDSFFATASPLVGQVRQGQLRLLAITGEYRSPAIPDVPTFKELGVKVPVTQWYGLVAPAGTPAEALAHLSEHLARALAAPEVREAITRDAASQRDLRGAAFQAFITEDIARYKAALTPALLKQISP